MRPTLPDLRGMLLALVVLGLLATGAELLLLEHTETVWQLLPLVVIGVALVVSAPVAFRATRGTLRVFQAIMGAMVVTGALGLIQHYRGNVEFELEMRPALEGWELFKRAMTGATPALAPGLMAHLGLLGLAYTWRHPLLRRRAADPPLER